MKKFILLLSTLLFLILLFGCTVNSSTGRITITNTSNTTITNVYVGSTLIVLSLAPGASYDYYYYKNIRGYVTLSGITNSTFSYVGDLNGIYDQSNYKHHLDDVIFTIKPGYWMRIYASTAEQSYSYNITTGMYEWVDQTQTWTDGSEEFGSGDDYIWCTAMEMGNEEYLLNNDWME